MSSHARAQAPAPGPPHAHARGHGHADPSRPPSVAGSNSSVSGVDPYSSNRLKLLCNMCWKPVTREAYATRCKHLLCFPHAKNWFARNAECPVCHHPIDVRNHRDIQAIRLNEAPNPLLLAGHDGATLFDRTIGPAFDWTMSQVRKFYEFKEYTINQEVEKIKQEVKQRDKALISSQRETSVAKHETDLVKCELNVAKHDLRTHQEKQERTEMENQQLREALAESNRLCQKWEKAYARKLRDPTSHVQVSPTGVSGPGAGVGFSPHDGIQRQGRGQPQATNQQQMPQQVRGPAARRHPYAPPARGSQSDPQGVNGMMRHHARVPPPSRQQHSQQVPQQPPRHEQRYRAAPSRPSPHTGVAPMNVSPYTPTFMHYRSPNSPHHRQQQPQPSYLQDFEQYAHVPRQGQQRSPHTRQQVDPRSAARQPQQSQQTQQRAAR